MPEDWYHGIQFDADPLRPITTEIPDGNWGANGRVVRLPDIPNSLLGEGGRQAALESLGKRAGW